MARWTPHALARHHTRLTPLLLFTAAFLVRLLYLNQIESFPTFYFPIMDEQYHVSLAEMIREGSLPDEPFFRAPLYMYFMAFLLTLTGESLYWVRFIQTTLGALLPVLVYALGNKLFNRSVAFWGTVAAVFYPTFLYYDASLLITFVMVLLITLLLYQLYRCEENMRRISPYIVAGALLGLAGLARPNILLLGPVLFVWVWLRLKPELGWKKALVRYVLIGVTSLIVIAPVTIRNYVVANDFVFIAWQGGLNFFLGNHRNANGWSALAPEIDPTWQGGYLQSISIAEASAGHALKRSKVSDYWFDRAFEEIAADPAHFVDLLFKKVRLFLEGYEIPNNQNIYLAKRFAPMLRPLMFDAGIKFPYGLLAPLAVIGLAFSLARWRRYLLVYLLLSSYMLSFILFFVCARFRQPLIPVLILLAVFGVRELMQLWRRKQFKNLALFVFVLGLLLVASNHSLLNLSPQRVAAEDHLLVGNAFLEQGRIQRAELEFKNALHDDSTFAQAYHNLAYIYSRQGQWGQAIKNYATSLIYDPYLVDAYINLATIYINRNAPDTAIALLEEAAGIHPYNDAVQLKLGITYFEAGLLDKAQHAVQRSLELNPSNATARDVLQQIQQYRRGREE